MKRLLPLAALVALVPISHALLTPAKVTLACPGSPRFKKTFTNRHHTFSAANIEKHPSNESHQSSQPIPDWIATGISGIYLAQFSGLYTQLPGLYGRTGLLPIEERIDSLSNSLWALNLFPAGAQAGMELFAAAGMAIAAAQIVFRPLRSEWPGFILYALLWIFWHDLVVAGGRFLQYQMDTLLLDVAPVTLIACFTSTTNWPRSNQEEATINLPRGNAQAASFGYRWLLARLYLGAGSVKLLSCDPSWRENLEAVHWHFQSQPLPNAIGVWAYQHVPWVAAQALTAFVLVAEMAAPFLFLAPSYKIRQVAFALHVVLMVGIATFGNFGTLQALLVILGLALLDQGGDYHPIEKEGAILIEEGKAVERNDDNQLVHFGVDAIALALATGGAFWAGHNIYTGDRCIDTLPIEPLAYDFIALGTLVAMLPLLGRKDNGLGTAFLSLFLVASTVTTLPVIDLPLYNFWDALNVGAQQYGLFATMTGVGGRPVPLMEAATSPDGPWHPIPLLYQVNDPDVGLPFCFPHFPRLDWTLWFLPFGETGLWIARFFQGITMGDPSVLGLIDEDAFHRTFPSEPPAIVRVVPRIYQWEGGSWQVSNDPQYADESFVSAQFTRRNLPSETTSTTEAWPSTPLVREFSTSVRPEYFIWGCFGATVATKRLVESNSLVTDWTDED